MNKIVIMQKLKIICEDVFELDDIEIDMETSSDSIEEWDSLAQISLIAACEEEFKIKFSMDQIISIKTIGDVFNIVYSRVCD